MYIFSLKYDIYGIYPVYEYNSAIFMTDPLQIWRSQFYRMFDITSLRNSGLYVGSIPIEG